MVGILQMQVYLASQLFGLNEKLKRLLDVYWKLIPKDRLTFMSNKITNNLSTIPNTLKDLNE